MDQADHLQRIEDGRLASVAEALIVNSIVEQEEKVIHRLKALYRNKIVEYPLYMAFVAELCALEDLASSLEYTKRQGEISAAKEFGNG